MTLTTALIATMGFLAAIPAVAAPISSPDFYWVYIGTFTFGPHQGIYASKLDLKSGALSEPRLVANAVDPNYLALHPSLPVLYASAGSEPPEKRQSGKLMSFRIDPITGGLTVMNQVTTNGLEAVYTDINPHGSLAIAAHYSSASVVAFSLESDGSLGAMATQAQQQGSSVHPRRQQHSYPHSICFDPAGKFAFSPDLGADKIFVYNVYDNKIKSHEPPYVSIAPGSGPRHMVFDSTARHAYLINELSNTIIVFNYNSATGILTPAQTISTLPAEFKGENTGADIRLHPSGKYLYASNRGHESIVIYSVDAESGTLRLLTHTPVQVSKPRGFAIDPTGQYLLAAGQQSNSLALFSIDPATGNLTFRSLNKVPQPVCILFFH